MDLPKNGTKTAIYLRKSLEEGQEASIGTQRAGAARLCEEMGWAVTHEVVDDGISRAEFIKRHGLNKLVAAAKRGEFSTLVVRDSSRLGGDMVRTALLLLDLRDCGCQVVYYNTREVVKLDSAEERLVVSIRGYADENEREKVASRTSEALREKALIGQATRGAPYGYTNVPVEGAAFKKARTGKLSVPKRVIVNEAEAAVIVRIFEEYAQGSGLRVIARGLNEDRVPTPQRHGKRSIGLWERTSIRQMLGNPRFVGVYTHGKQQSTYRGGTKVKVQREKTSAHLVTCPYPPIVSPSLWDKVATKLASNPGFGKAKTTKGRPAKYLLSGLIKCGVCGGNISARSTSKHVGYTCRKQREFGKEVCTNNKWIGTAKLDRMIAGGVQAGLTEEFMGDFFTALRALLAKKIKAQPNKQAALSAEGKKLRTELARLSDRLAEADNADAIVAAINTRSKRLKAVEQELAVAPAAAQLALDSMAELESAARQLLSDLPALLVSDVRQGQRVLRALFPEPLVMSKDKITGAVALSNCVNLRSKMPTVGSGLGDVIDVSQLPVVRFSVPLKQTA